MELKQRILALSALNGPSGFEDEAADEIQRQMSVLSDKTERDVMGNIIAVRYSGKANAPKLLLDAHMDEIGLVITGSEEGFLKFSAIGGVDQRMLPGREVLILTDPPVFGVITCTAPHVQSAGEADKAIKAEDLFIDAGYISEDIPVGTPAVFYTRPFELSDGRICGKSLDDRACVAILLDVLNNLKDKDLQADIYVMASVQEEVGMRGAAVGAFSIAPDYCIAVDVTHASTPDAPSSKQTFALGSGACIGVGPNMNRNITKALIDTAERRGIRHALEIMPGNTGTNAWVMQVAGEGISTAVVSLPLRYMHSPVEVLECSDAEEISKLLTEFILSFNGRLPEWN